MTGTEILKAMDEGHVLHGGRFGFWFMSPIDARCKNVHNGAARALLRKGLIKKVGETQFAETQFAKSPPNTKPDDA